MRISATIEVGDTDIDFEIDDDATDEEIEEQLGIEAESYVQVISWEREQ